MSWIASLYETYENLSLAAVQELLPIAHSVQNAQIELEIDTDGTFISAGFVKKEDSETLIPVTEKSASRAGAVSAPHPLCDNLQYLSKNLGEYADVKSADFHQDYVKQLKAWHESEYTTPKIDAVYKYITEGDIIKDLLEAGMLSLDENGKLTEKWEKATNVTLSVGEQKKAFIRFLVAGDGYVRAVWQDSLIRENWIKYYLASSPVKELCYVTGENTMPAISFPRKIRNSADGAKLISSNDTSGFTYRGRFTDDKQAVQLGFEVSQKAHNALKYLIKKQGETVGERVFVLWGTKGENTPLLDSDTYDEMDDEDDASEFAETREDCAKRFNKAIKGYKADVDFDTKLILMGIDAATKGRMSIVYYNEYVGEQVNALLENIKRWHTLGAWRQDYKKDKDGKRVVFYGIPSPSNLALAAYGTNQNGMLKISNEKLAACIAERLLPCISDGRKVPKDITDALIVRSSQPQNYNNFYQWKRVLTAACPMYVKYLYDHKGVNMDNDLEKNSTSIDYILGRMAAILHTIEKRSLYNRNVNVSDYTTNVMRYFTRLMHFPNQTFTVLYQKTVPYNNRLGEKGNNLNETLQRLTAMLDPEEFAKARNLDGRFILGFDSQLQAPPCIGEKNDTDKKEVNENEGEE